MRDQSVDAGPSSMALSLDELGARWSLLIISEAFLGTCRFDDFQRRLGIARNILAVRLDGLVSAGVLDRVQYRDRPPRMEYRLSDKGRDLFPLVTALRQWGDKWLQADEPPLVLEHECGREAWFVPTCAGCGRELNLRNTHPRVGGPGAPP